MEPEIITPSASSAQDYFAEIADIAALPPEQLRQLLAAQIDALQVKANHRALKIMRELAQPEFVGAKREAATKELMGLGMFSDALSRQRVNLGKQLGDGGANAGAPTVQIPATLPDSDWEKKYASNARLTLPEPKGKPQ